MLSGMSEQSARPRRVAIEVERRSRTTFSSSHRLRCPTRSVRSIDSSRHSEVVRGHASCCSTLCFSTPGRRSARALPPGCQPRRLLGGGGGGRPKVLPQVLSRIPTVPLCGVADISTVAQPTTAGPTSSVTEASTLAVVGKRLYLRRWGPLQPNQRTAWISLGDAAALRSAPREPCPILGLGAGVTTGVPGNYFWPGPIPTLTAPFDPWWVRWRQRCAFRTRFAPRGSDWTSPPCPPAPTSAAPAPPER